MVDGLARLEANFTGQLDGRPDGGRFATLKRGHIKIVTACARTPWVNVRNQLDGFGRLEATARHIGVVMAAARGVALSALSGRNCDGRRNDG
jgi:hypothetical protein